MSASLVGSEMCIRDRLPLPGGYRHPDTPTSALPMAPEACFFGEEGGAAVSYTHLTLPTICSV
eukprot:1858752-Alexandrium_andersonii.AAC.1